ncbi:transglycosylase SLT domain-containing protein [Hydrogenophaga crassostreae]|uniref:Lytic transglycosylase n=1 Tax=Hydrogenophaga crassostreae TaxID=1763535 RepID=A0A1D8NVI5_9BURK|nr:transglycosylase SLT domain-containing protein [Hydrogenophaga crassostreae]AOW13111.1 lytic transglycosylase [Hydrogenophaga crassostreae]
MSATPLHKKPTRARSSTTRLAAFLALSLGVFLAGCVGVVDPRKAAAVKPAPTSTGSSTVNAPEVVRPAPAVANAPKAVYSAPLSPITASTVSSRSVASLAAPNDIWDRIRRGFAMTDLNSDLVRDKEQWYASRPDYLQRMTDRSNRYLFHIVEEIERRGMPSELALLPFIESAFNPQAVSSARAAGMWQFMPATGESFDLKQNVFRDDRRDVLASTQAALDYLQQLHDRFGDWHLALAAYNWGQGNVNRAITRNQQAGLPTDYNSLDMPTETRQYVPKLQAVKNIVAFPETFNAQLPDIGNHPFFDAISISQDIDVALVIRLAEINEADFRALNPSLKQPVVMSAGTPQILLPWDNANVFERRLAEHKGPLASWTVWVVPSTLSVSEAARRVGMSESELRSVNNIPPRMQVRAGSSLLVARSSQRDNDVSEYVADNARLSLQPEAVARRASVRVRSGDTLSGIARRYGMSTADLAKLNNLSARARLRTGQRLAVAGSSSQSAKVVVIRESQLAAKRSSSSSKTSKSSRVKIKVKRASATRSSKNSRTSKAQSSSAKKSPAKSSPAKKKKRS